MKYDKVNRRLFLQGAGKAMLIVPLLPSLMPSIARAAAFDTRPRYASLFLPYGPTVNNFFPSAGNFTSVNSPTLHTIRHSPIITNASTGISYLFDKRYNPFASKMTYLHGLDTTYDGHHYAAGMNGNLRGARDSGAVLDMLNYMPTIDHIMAYSPGFYPSDVGYVRQLVIKLMSRNSGEYISAGFSNAIGRSGPIVETAHQSDPKAVFDSIFGSFTAPKSPSGSTPIVDSVLADYKSVRAGRSIGSEDAKMLDSHIELLAQLETKLNTKVTLSCTPPNRM